MAVVDLFEDAWIAEGVRTPFVDYNGALAGVSPIDLGIKVGREVTKRAGVPAQDIDMVIAGSMAQASFDAYFLPRHIALYSGAPIETPAHLVQRVCGTGIELISQASDAVSRGKATLVLCAGAESMSRNPVSAYTHRSGFRMGQIEFKDFLWEALLDPAATMTMGDTAENLARQYQISRESVDEFASRSFDRALKAQASGILAEEIVPVSSETFQLNGYKDREIKLDRKMKDVATDTHVRPSPVHLLAKIKPAFGGVQTGGNSSAIVDGAAAALVTNESYLNAKGIQPLARVLTVAVVGVPPEIMGIGPVPAVRAVLKAAKLKLADIDLIEINEAFGAQVLACARELALDEEKLNVNGGAIAIGHPLAASGVRLTVTLAHELRRRNARYGISSACIGGGQGIALLIENPNAS